MDGPVVERVHRRAGSEKYVREAFRRSTKIDGLHCILARKLTKRSGYSFIRACPTKVRSQVGLLGEIIRGFVVLLFHDQRLLGSEKADHRGGRWVPSRNLHCGRVWVARTPYRHRHPRAVPDVKARQGQRIDPGQAATGKKKLRIASGLQLTH